MAKHFAGLEVLDETKVSIGVGPALYAAERIILNDGRLEDSNPLLYPARIYGNKGSIPNVVKTTLQEVHTTTLVKGGGEVHRDIPTSLYCLRMQLKNRRGILDLEHHLEDERLRGHKFLYHGLASWGYVLPILIDGIAAPPLSLKNKFGRAVYLTDDLTRARDYAGIQDGAILLFNWTDDKGLLEKTLIGNEWENAVKGCVCSDVVESEPASSIHTDDMLIGSVTKNYNVISHCSKPVLSKYHHFVGRNEQAFNALNKSLYAIIYLE